MWCDMRVLFSLAPFVISNLKFDLFEKLKKWVYEVLVSVFSQIDWVKERRTPTCAYKSFIIIPVTFKIQYLTRWAGSLCFYLSLPLSISLLPSHLSLSSLFFTFIPPSHFSHFIYFHFCLSVSLLFIWFQSVSTKKCIKKRCIERAQHSNN